eukprot:g45649.t1
MHSAPMHAMAAFTYMQTAWQQHYNEKCWCIPKHNIELEIYTLRESVMGHDGVVRLVYVHANFHGQWMQIFGVGATDQDESLEKQAALTF